MAKLTARDNIFAIESSLILDYSRDWNNLKKDYAKRDVQIVVLKQLISKVVLARAHYYLNSALNNQNLNTTSGKASFFHDLSEGIGFVLSTMETDNGSGIELVTEAELKSSGVFQNNLLIRPVSAWDFLDAGDDRNNLIALRDLLAIRISAL